MLAWAVFCAVAAGVGLALLLMAQGPNRWTGFLAGGHSDAPATALLGTFFGAVLIAHRSRNAVGWLLLLSSASQGAHLLANEYAVAALAAGAATQLSLLAAFASPLTLIASAGPLILLILAFPDGRLHGSAGRALAALAVVDVLVAASVDAVVTWPLRGPALLDSARAASPLELRHPALLATELTTAIVALAAVAASIREYRRAGGVVRQQLKWFAAGFGLLVVLVIASHLLPQPIGGLLAALSPHPGIAGIYVALRRYRLYDIDRLISRGVAYLLLTGAVGGVYVLSATLLAWAFGSYTGGGTLAVAASAVVAAAVFSPARRRLQDFGDRAFRRRAYEARRVMGGYIAHLGVAEPAPGTLQAAAAAALDDPGARVALWLPRLACYVDEHGDRTSPEPSEPGRVATSVDRGGAHLGFLVHRAPAHGDDPGLAADVARAAAAAFDHARLRAQVLTQLAEVRASRSRIVAAGDEQRRRIERDLHDGAQQRLLAIALELSRLEQRIAAGRQDRLAERLRELTVEVQEAIAELRELARGLVPPVLADRGLVAAVDAIAERSPISVKVDSAVDREPPAEVQAAAYYVAAEALANVIRHARATRARIALRGRSGRFSIEVEDDGVGGARLHLGTGLLGLRDRVDAAGGTLAVSDRPGGGTVVRAEFPKL